jgi:hypothetical protein
MSMVRALRNSPWAISRLVPRQAAAFELTSRQAGVLKLARRPSAESALDPLGEAGQLLGRGGF